MNPLLPTLRRIRLDTETYRGLRQQILERDGWRARHRGADAGIGQILRLLPGNDLRRLFGRSTPRERQPQGAPMLGLFRFLPETRKEEFLSEVAEAA